MFHIKNVIPRKNGGSVTSTCIQNRSSRTAASASPCNSPRRDHGLLNENEAAALSPVSASHHHYDNLLHLTLRGLGDPRRNAKLQSHCVMCAKAFAVCDVLCQLPCGHFHHSECILQWLDTSQMDTCPTCGQHISETPSTAAGAVGRPIDVADEDGYFDYKNRRHCNPMFQKRQNFDLIMRRVLRAREEQRVLSEEKAKHDYPSWTNDYDGDDEPSCNEAAILEHPLKKIVFHDAARKLASSDHTRQTSISSSSDWLVDDLEEYLNIADDDTKCCIAY
jgi:hypothetical protein